MKDIAVVGAGIAGLSAAYLLSRRHRVTLYEREPRLGGHTHTVVVEDAGGHVALDTGFLVHNAHTYPQLVRLFRELDVATQPSDMSFSVQCAASGLEYSSRGLSGFFAQRRNLARPGHYALLREIVRFNREAPSVLGLPGAEAWTIADFLRDRAFSGEFTERYLVPMTSAIWSTSYAGIHAFPIQTLVRFMHNHGMLSVGAHPTWRVVVGGSHVYVPRLTAVLHEVRADVHLDAVARDARGVTLRFRGGRAERHDDVVFACHGDQVLPLLESPTDAERDVFQHFATTANDVWLHTDARALPAAARARASWNYRLATAPDAPPTVTYHLNRLQSLTAAATYCVTLNPQTEIARDRVIRRMQYRHPCYTVPAVRAQQRWGEVSGRHRTHYCGAYWRYGFHEDGLLSAIRVAASLGVEW